MANEMTKHFDALWDEFLARWPLKALPQMTLQQYTQVGDKDSFCNWLETRTEDLGSIWGGSSFKFGVYSRKDQSPKSDEEGRQYAGAYAWLSKYGSSPESAFEKVRDNVVKVAKAARAGDLDAVDKVDMGTVTKWKIAFLYQDRAKPSVLPLYKPASLRAVSGQTNTASCAELHRWLMSRREGQHVLDYGQQLWNQVETIEAELLTSEAALAWLQQVDGLQAIKPPTEKMAGFRLPDGRELALIRQNKVPTVFVSPGTWASGGLMQYGQPEHYQPDQSRNSGFEANAPSLGQGHPAVSIKVKTLQALVDLFGAYADRDLDDIAVPVVRPQPGVNGGRTAVNAGPLNQILFGPPGTGKTFATIDHALAILDPGLVRQHQGQETPEARAALKRRFDELAQAGRIRFVTFHQSFSYEDFVEGLRAVSDEDSGGQLRYEVVDGVFKDLCLRAQAMAHAQPVGGAGGAPLTLDGRRIWKMSLGSAAGERAYVFDDCLHDGVALLGYGHSLDYSGCSNRQQVRDRMAAAGHPTEDNDYAATAVNNFVNTMRQGDLIVVTEGNLKFRAIGEVTGDYRYDARNDEDHYRQSRAVRWLRRFEPALGYAELMHNRFSQMTLYELREGSIDMGKLAALLAPAPETTASGEALPHVLIIDEINRGNVSRVFGELITLIEPSKRAGAAEALSVTLPYSHQSFSVPGNVHLIGTMNTADRSLAGLDVALRRRFVFKEMQPRPELLDGVVVHGVDMGRLLRTLNERIEALLDREHCLGHAYFMPLKGLAGAEAEAKLAEVFANQVLPLLQEYFFDDWQRIQWVLNDHRKPEPQHRFVQDQPLNVAALFGVDVPTSASSKTWRVNAGAFALAASYQGVLATPAVAGEQGAP